MINNFNNKGIALFISIALLFLLSVAAIAVLRTAYNYNYVCENEIKRVKAITSAESGINYAFYKLKNNATTKFYPNRLGIDNADISLSGMNGLSSVQVWLEDYDPPVSGKYIIKSKAAY